MTVSFFGLAATLDPLTTLLVFSGLVSCLVLFEHALEEIETLAEEAGYKELVKKVYKEMMIMGFLGFGVFMAFNVFTLEHDENFLAFEFAHLTVFFIGIILVMRAFLAIYISSRSTTSNWVAHNANCGNILRRIEATETSSSLEGFLYRHFNLFSPLQHIVNYKMLEEYFHKDFNISRVEFRFVDYLTKHNVYYAMELTEVSIHSWLAIIFVVILNFIRILVYDNGLHSCAGDEDDHSDDDHAYDTNTTEDHRRYLSGGDDSAEFHLTRECADFGTEYFLFCGALLIFFGFLVCFVNYWSEKKVSQVGKCWTSEEQISILRGLEEEEGGRSSSQRILEENSADVWHVCSLRKVLEEKKIEEYHHHISQERKVKEFFKAFTNYCWTTKAAQKVQTVDEIKKLKMSNKAKLTSTGADADQSSLKLKERSGAVTVEEKGEHPLLFEFDDPMFFKNRKAHKFLTECFQMLMALFIGMYLTNYLFVSQLSSHFVLYLFITLLEILILLIEMSFLQDTACSLLAVTSLINEAAEMMCEEDHIKAKLLPTIRQEIIALTPPDKNLENHLNDIYNFVNFDADDNGIGLKEFSSLLFTVDIILPDNEVDILFRAVDSNGSGNIELRELLELFRPNSTLVSVLNEDGDTMNMKKLSHQNSLHPHPSAPSRGHGKPHTVVPIVTENDNDSFVDIENAGGDSPLKEL